MRNYLKIEEDVHKEKIVDNFHQNSEGYPAPLVHQFIKDLEEFTYKRE